MSVVKNVSRVWLGSILGAVLGFLLQAVIARNLTVEEFGFFSSTYAAIGLLIPMAGFGIAQYWLKVFGQCGMAAKVYISPALKLLAINLIFICFILMSWGYLEKNNPEVVFIILFLSVHVIGQVTLEVLFSRYQLEENYSVIFYIQFIPHLLRFFAAIILLYIFGDGFSPKDAALAYAIAAFLFILVSIRPVRNFILGDFPLVGHKTSNFILERVKIKAVFKDSWPFAFAALFHLIYFQSDIIILKYLKGDQAAGYYSVAFMILTAVLIFPSVVYQKVLLPRLHRWAHDDRDKFHSVYKKGNFIMAVMGIIAMLLTWLLAPIFIPLLFGEKYEYSVDILNITALSIPILFVASSVGAVLVTKENMKIKVKVMFFVAVLNLALNIIFIPIYGELGAAVTTVISNFILLVGYYYVSEKIIFKVEGCE